MCKSNCCACCCCCKCSSIDIDMRNIREAFEDCNRNKVTELENMNVGEDPYYHVLLQNSGYFTEEIVKKLKCSGLMICYAETRGDHKLKVSVKRICDF